MTAAPLAGPRQPPVGAAFARSRPAKRLARAGDGVIEREPAGRAPFSEVEDELFAEARIWNMFDAQNAAAPGETRGTRR